MHIVRWLFSKIVFVGVMVAAFIYNIEGAKNILLIFPWFNLILLLILSQKEAIKKQSQDKNYKLVPNKLTEAFGVFFTVMFVWNGWFVTSVITLLNTFIALAIYTSVEKKRKELKDEEEKGKEETEKTVQQETELGYIS